MQDIDFLPADFREKTARRRGGAWRLVAALALLAVVGVVDIRMRMIHSATHQQLLELQDPYAAAQETRTRLATLQNELALVDEHADLMAYLSHRWPVSQLLAVATITAPEEVHLNEIRLDRHFEDGNLSQTGSRGGDIALASDKVATPSTAASALAELSRLSGVETLTLTGTTRDTVAAQQFVTNLSRAPLVKTANLKAMSKANGGKLGKSTDDRSQFVVQVTVVSSLATIHGPGEGEPPRISRLDRPGEP